MRSCFNSTKTRVAALVCLWMVISEDPARQERDLDRTWHPVRQQNCSVFISRQKWKKRQGLAREQQC